MEKLGINRFNIMELIGIIMGASLLKVLFSHIVFNMVGQGTIYAEILISRPLQAQIRKMLANL